MVSFYPIEVIKVNILQFDWTKETVRADKMRVCAYLVKANHSAK